MKTTCRRADESQKAVLDRLTSIVERAVNQRWTVVRVKAALGAQVRGERAARATELPLFAKAAKGTPRRTVHLDRVRDPAFATPGALDALLAVLRDLIRELESGPRQPPPWAAAPKRAASRGGDP